MSERERTGVRDLSYSRWHRTDSMSRFLPKMTAFACSVIDIDWCEYCRVCFRPVALIETQQSKAKPKPARVTTRLARMAGIEAFSVSYLTDERGDCTAFRVQCLEPFSPDVAELSPGEYASFLAGLRLGHDCVRQLVSA